MKEFMQLKKVGVVLLSALLMAGCTSGNIDNTDQTVVNITDEEVPLSGRAGKVEVLVPTASNQSVKKNDYALLDYSNSSQGYVMLKYLKAVDKKIKVQVSLNEGCLLYTSAKNDRFKGSH